MSVLYEYSEEVLFIPVDCVDETKVVGLDYKSDGLYCDSNGDFAGMPHYYRKAQRRLARAQRRLSRMKGSGKGEAKSSNYLKQFQKVNRIHRHVVNQRKDFLHKLSTETANQYEVVCIESLDMKSMANKGFGNGKATMDNGNGLFTEMLKYKQADRGHYLIEIDRWYASSQILHCNQKES